MIPTTLAAYVFAVLLGVVVQFQLALALGAPWGGIAMGGAFPGVYPPAMRFAALAQAALLICGGLVVLARADLVLPSWRRASRLFIWIVVVLLAIGVVLNLITPNPLERLVWAPVAGLLFLTSLRVALSR